MTLKKKSHTKPFRLLELPLEIIRKILLECIGEQWQVHDDYMRWLGRFRAYRTLSFPDAILLINRRLNEEVKKLITLYKTGTYVAYTGTIETQPLDNVLPSAFFDDGITTIKLQMENRDALGSFRYNNVSRLKARFRHLQFLEISLRQQRSENTQRRIKSRPLLSVLRSEEDFTLCAEIDQYFIHKMLKQPDKTLADLLCGVTVHLKIHFHLCSWCPCTRDPCFLKFQVLIILFGISGDGCWIEDKKISAPYGKRFNGTKVDTAIAVLEGRLADAQEDLEIQRHLQRTDDGFESSGEDEP